VPLRPKRKRQVQDDLTCRPASAVVVAAFWPAPHRFGIDVHVGGDVLAAGRATATSRGCRRGFKAITEAAGLGEDWTPRELRHTFVSILSANEVSIEAIADLVGHRTTIVTQKVYRHQLRPVMSKGATTMNAIFTKAEEHRAG
jgi:integrase